MTDKYKGVVEIEILGAKRGFKVGTMSLVLFCEAEKIPFDQAEAYLKDGGTTIGLKFYHCAAVAYARLMKQQEPTFDELCAWVDELGFEKMEKELDQSTITPNSEAPKVAGLSQENG